MVLLCAVLISVALAVFVVAPLLAADGARQQVLPIDVTPLADLKRRRLVVYENLQDLEFEFQAGKISREDYQSLRENYLGKAAQLMIASQQEEQMASEGELIERAV